LSSALNDIQSLSLQLESKSINDDDNDDNDDDDDNVIDEATADAQRSVVLAKRALRHGAAVIALAVCHFES
jgi:hypothetical protein